MKEIINIYWYLPMLIFITIALAAVACMIYKFIDLKLREEPHAFSNAVGNPLAIGVLFISVFILFCMYDLSVATPSRARQCVESSASSLTFDDFNKWFSGEPEAQALADPLPEEVIGCVYCFNEAKSAYDYVYCIGSSDHRVTFTIKVDENGSNILEWT